MLTNANKGTYLVKKEQKCANVIYERPLISRSILGDVSHPQFHLSLNYFTLLAGTLKKPSYLVSHSTSDILELQLVGDAEISPSKVALFNHVDNYVDLSIRHGSGYFDVTNTGDGVAKHHYTAVNKSVSLTFMVILRDMFTDMP